MRVYPMTPITTIKTPTAAMIVVRMPRESPEGGTDEGGGDSGGGGINPPKIP
jgi:hypothetical protein